MDSDFIKQAIFAFIRLFGGPAIAYIALKLGLAEDVVTTVVVATVTTAVMYVWSLANKYRYEEKVTTALELPANASKATLKDVIANK